MNISFSYQAQNCPDSFQSFANRYVLIAPLQKIRESAETLDGIEFQRKIRLK